MKKPSQIFRHTVTPYALSVLCEKDDLAGDVMDVLPVGQDGRIARLYFSADIDTSVLSTDAADDVVWSRVVSYTPVMDVLRGTDGSVRLPLEGVDVRLPVNNDQSGILADRNVILGHCNNEPAEAMRDWLVWHCHHHAANGAVIVERGGLGTADRKAETLQELLDADPAVQAALGDTPILIVDFGCPLGEADKGHETHPMNAPDAPGKERMTAPQPDAWHAPLSYKLLFDLMRQRFLTRARAVANLEVMDLDTPAPDGQTMFDMAVGSTSGILPLCGKRAYPWNIRKKAQPAFGDHICARFDDPSFDWRWCVAPDRLPEGTIWMRERVLGAKTHSQALPFWRFMAMRFGRMDGHSVGQIVPKTSLVEDDRLLDISRSFNANPMRQPKEIPAEARLNDDGKPLGNKVTVVTTMKNEGPFILEWIAYHRAIGIENFLVYTNDCTDGTDGFLKLLEQKGLCQWRDNPYRQVDMKPQHAALDAANDEEMVKNADWTICMDVDEYIAVHTGEGSVQDLFAAVPDANMISLTWRLFGNNDVDLFNDSFITQDFTRCAHELANKPHQAWGFKTMYRNIGLFRKIGVHRPKGLLPTAVDRINWVNGSGKPMPKNQWRNAWRSHSGTYGYDLVSLNHYAVRSAESFLVKRDRGRVNHVDRDQGMAYWFRMNHNVVEDNRMARILPRLQAEVDRILSDPEINAAHQACVKAHAEKVAELKAQPKYTAFHAELVSDRMKKLSRLHGHFGSNVYLAGPQVIPDEIVARDPKEDFFFTVDEIDETQH